MRLLRTIVLESGLTEELKWSQPCYMFEKTNVLIISAFKEYCVLSFFKGVLLKDPNHILSSPGENSQAVRMVRFTDIKEIVRLKPVLKVYIREAIELQKAGAKVQFKKITEHKMPEELQAKLKRDPVFKSAFEALTPGRQRAYMLYFAQPKQAKTRESRIEKCRQQILDGKGLNDYKRL